MSTGSNLRRNAEAGSGSVVPATGEAAITAAIREDRKRLPRAPGGEEEQQRGAAQM